MKTVTGIDNASNFKNGKEYIDEGIMILDRYNYKEELTVIYAINENIDEAKEISNIATRQSISWFKDMYHYEG